MVNNNTIKTKNLTSSSIGARQGRGMTDNTVSNSGTVKVQAPTPKEQLKNLNIKRKDLKNQIKQLDKEETQIKKGINNNKKKITNKTSKK